MIKVNQKKWAIIIALSLITLAATLYVLNNRRSAEDNGWQKALSQLEKRQGVSPALRLETGLIPPTNKWFSGIVFGESPQPVYAHPLAMQPKPDGSMTISYPSVKAGKDTVFAPHVDDITLKLDAPNVKVTRYDDLTFDLDHHTASNQLVARTSMAQGSSYIFTTLKTDKKVSIISGGTIRSMSNDVYQLTLGEKIYGVYAKHGSVQGNIIIIDGLAGDVITTFVTPSVDLFDKVSSFAPNIVTSGTVDYALADNKLTTSYQLKTKQGQTLFALPSSDKSSGLNYSSLLGNLAANSGNSWQTVEPIPQMDETLSLDKITQNQKNEIITYIKKDIQKLEINKTDTYFGGKELYRAAQLLDLSHNLKLNNESKMIQEKLRSSFDIWLNPSGPQNISGRRFYYDDRLKGVVGLEPAFGSEQFNDHHFHYGYFLQAASILARYDKDFVKQHGNVVTLLAKDIANTQTSSDLPTYRVFDQYRGHSWASGFANFADGNNQESSSEATNAWFGVYLWGKAAGNSSLQDTGLTLYTRENNASKKYWLNNELSQTFPGFDHTFASLVWGGKIDSATFFSPRPQAKLGIQLIPMSQAQQNLSSEVVESQLQEVAPKPTDYKGQFGDYLVMYLSLVDSQKASTIAKSLPETYIDDANSRAYMMAWIYAQGANSSNQ